MAIAELVVKLIGDVSGFSKSMAQVGKDISKTGKNLTASGAAMTKAITLPLVGFATASLMMAGDFQASMSKVSALGDITGSDLKKLEAQAIELGAKTQFSAKQAAEGMGEFASAGFSAQQIGEAMAGTLDLAAAAQISVGEAAGITATTLGQFNMQASEAGRVADVMAKGAASGKLTITELAESLKYVGPVAYATGRSLEETTAAISLLSNAGIVGSQAGTALRMGMIRFIKPTKQAQEVINDLGLSLTDGAGKIKPLEEIIGQLAAKHANLADVTKLVGVEAATAWQALVDKGAPALHTLTEANINANGSAAEMAATLRDNLKGSFEQMSGAVETLGISIGMALTPAARGLMGIIQSLAEKAVGLVEAFRGLSPQMQNAILAFTGIVAIGGPIVLIVGQIVTGIGAFIKTLATARTALVLFTSVTGIGLIVVAIGLATAAIVYFKDDIADIFGKISTIVQNVCSKIGGVLTAVWDTVKEPLKGFVDFFTGAFQTIVGYVSEWGKRIGAVLYALLDVWLSQFGTSLSQIGEAWAESWDSMINYFSNFGTDFSNGLQVIGDFFNEVLGMFGTNWETAWSGIYNYFVKFKDDFFKGLDVIGDYVASVVNFIKDTFVKGLDLVVDALGYAQSAAGLFSDSSAQAIGNLQDAIKKLKDPIVVVRQKIDDTTESTGQLTESIAANTGAVKANNTSTTVTLKTTKELKEGNDKLAGAHDKVTGAAKKKTAAEKEAEKQERIAEKAADDYAKSLEELVTSSEKYQKALGKINDESTPAAEKGQELIDIYKEGSRKLSDYNTANKEYADAVRALSGGENLQAGYFEAVTEKLKDAERALDEFKGKAKDANTGGFFGGDMGSPKVSTDLIDDFSKELSSALGGALSDVLSGKSLRNQLSSIGQGLGSSLGQTAGAAFGGPFGAAVGGAIGGVIGEKIGASLEGLGKDTKSSRSGVRMILDMMFPGGGQAFDAAFGDKLFAGDSEGTITRKKIDGWFAKQFESARIMAVINGQLQQLKDFDFGGGMFNTEDSAAAKYFQGIEASAKTSFEGIGSYFAELLGVGQEYSKGIAESLALNVGGSLNNLQLMLEGLGLSFDDAKKVMMNAFLDGKMSFLDAKKALDSLVQVTQKGIPDGVGYTIQAFDNLKAAGTKGGRVSTDALKDLGFEAKELGLKTIPQLMANLASSGKFTQKEIDQVFKALSENGIDSIDKLTDATDDQLLGALAQLQSVDFPFADAVSDAKDLGNALKGIPDKKELTFTIKTNFDANTQAAMKAGYVPNTNGSTNTIKTSTPTPSANGNVFSAGSVRHFAKGGVVSDFTAFDIGTMAERGPEAIMPLERLPDGRLGVLSAASNSGGGGTTNHFTINAPYAQPGVTETIKRELDKYFDTRNKLPGIRR